MVPMTPVVPGFDLPITTYAKDQPEYNPLPCHRQPNGDITIRWKLTWKERILVAFGGSLWHTVKTFNQPLQPIRLTATCPIMGHTGHDPEI